MSKAFEWDSETPDHTEELEAKKALFKYHTEIQNDALRLALDNVGPKLTFHSVAHILPGSLSLLGDFSNLASPFIAGLKKMEENLEDELNLDDELDEIEGFGLDIQDDFEIDMEIHDDEIEKFRKGLFEEMGLDDPDEELNPLRGWRNYGKEDEDELSFPNIFRDFDSDSFLSEYRSRFESLSSRIMDASKKGEPVYELFERMRANTDNAIATVEKVTKPLREMVLDESSPLYSVQKESVDLLNQIKTLSEKNSNFFENVKKYQKLADLEKEASDEKKNKGLEIILKSNERLEKSVDFLIQNGEYHPDVSLRDPSYRAAMYAKVHGSFDDYRQSFEQSHEAMKKGFDFLGELPDLPIETIIKSKVNLIPRDIFEEVIGDMSVYEFFEANEDMPSMKVFAELAKVYISDFALFNREYIKQAANLFEEKFEEEERAFNKEYHSL